MGDTWNNYVHRFNSLCRPQLVGKVLQTERQVNEWGGCLAVCVTSLKCTYARTAPICLYAAVIMLLTHFHSEPTNLSITGARRYKCHRLAVQAQQVLPSFLLAPTSRERTIGFRNTAAMRYLDPFTVMVVSMCWRIHFTSAWYVAYLWKKSF